METRHAFVGDQSGQVTILKLEQDSCSLVTTFKGHTGTQRTLHTVKNYCRLSLYFMKYNIVTGIDFCSDVLWTNINNWLPKLPCSYTSKPWSFCLLLCFQVLTLTNNSLCGMNKYLFLVCTWAACSFFCYQRASILGVTSNKPSRFRQ